MPKESYKCINYKYITHKLPVLLHCCVLVLLCTCAPCRAQGVSQYPSQSNLDDSLFSPSVGQKFYEIAYELANSPQANGQDELAQVVEQAIIFLEATTNLDSGAGYVLGDMIKLASHRDDPNNLQIMRNLLDKYVDESADVEVAEKAIQYLLEQFNSREEREQLITGYLQNLGGKNAVLDSDLETLLGLLMAEKADLKSAQFYLTQAYNSNKYNRLAFAKLTELAAEQVGPAVQLEHLRLVLGENPLDMEAAMAFAQYAEQLQLYDVAAQGYRYCADLFRYLYPSQELAADIYIPWAMSSYNTQRNQHKCLQIASQLRQSGRFDLLVEAIAGKAAIKIGDTEQANKIFDEAEEKAAELIESDPLGVNYEQLAWFYCFARPDADKAVSWANKAYSSDPNSPMAAAILAYSLVMNGQMDLARTLVDSYQSSQIAELTLAKIQLAEGKEDLAIETLKSAIITEAGSLEAETAKEILSEHGGEYVPSIDTDITMTALTGSFGPEVVPAFISPDKAVSVQLNVRGSKFSYGSRFGATLAITNNSSEPLVICDDGLLKGNIRIDADISGDINKKIPNLAVVKIRPALPVGPGKSILIPLRLVTAELRRILISYPQASLNIEFTGFIDPVADGQKVSNRLADIEPAKVAVERPGIKLTGKYLQNRFSSLSKGQQGQRIKAAELFAGLLTEQNAMANREPLYKFTYADWMPAMLKSALLQSIADSNWVVKVHTMAAMLSVPLDYEMINAVAQNLNDTHWPVRLMAIYLLDKNQQSNFGKVLDWSAKYDTSRLVRDMAIALGAAKPQEQKPANMQLPSDSGKQSAGNKD